jgi:hypothetical protein
LKLLGQTHEKDFSTEILKGKKTWKDAFQVLRLKKKQTCKPKLLYPSKLTFIIKEKLKPSIISKN